MYERIYKKSYRMTVAEYIDELKKYAHDNDVMPQFTVYSDNKGRVYFHGCDNLSHAERLQILGRAFQAMYKATADDQAAIKMATPLDISKLKPLK
jgi:hypothetical protein